MSLVIVSFILRISCLGPFYDLEVPEKFVMDKTGCLSQTIDATKNMLQRCSVVAD